MAAAVFDRRRAERFAQLLDQAEGKGRRHSRTTMDDELADYVALGRLMSARKSTHRETPDPDFRSSLRAMLVATAEREGIGVTADKHRIPADKDRRQVVGPIYLSAAAQVGAARPGRPAKRGPVIGSRRTRGAIIVGILAGTLALSGMSMASGDAVPGDPLYGVKRSTESAQLALAGSDVDRGQTYLGFARNRGREATTVQDDPAALMAVLDDLDNQAAEGVRLLTSAALIERDSTALDLVDDYVTAQRPVIIGLLTGLSGPALTRAEHSLSLIDRIGKRAADLRAALTCGPADAGSDSLGPKPPPCPGASRVGQTGPDGAGH
jgi:hypothetical protein